MTTLSDELKRVEVNLSQQLQQNKSDIEAKVETLGEAVKVSAAEIHDEIIGVRNHVMNVLQNENRKLRNRVQTLESRVLSMEKTMSRIDQNHRKNNFEISGIPQNVNHTDLKATVVNMVNTISEDKITINDVEACHRLGSHKTPAPTIVRMSRNLVDSVMKNKRNLVGIDKKLNNLPDGTKLYINHNLSPNMKRIESNARQLLRDEWISGTWFSNASVRVKCLNGRTLKIDHEMDLYEAFPSYTNFTFDTDLYDRVLNLDMEQFNEMSGAWDDHDFFPPESSAVEVTTL